jgi:hypothetical protein
MMEMSVFGTARLATPAVGASGVDLVLFPLVMVVQETMCVYDKLVDIMVALHHDRAQGATLGAQRARFEDQHRKLRQLYRDVRSTPALAALIEPPLLPEAPPNFAGSGGTGALASAESAHVLRPGARGHAFALSRAADDDAPGGRSSGISQGLPAAPLPTENPFGAPPPRVSSPAPVIDARFVLHTFTTPRPFLPLPYRFSRLPVTDWSKICVPKWMPSGRRARTNAESLLLFGIRSTILTKA